MKNFTKQIFERTEIHTSDRDIEKVLKSIKTTSNIWLIISLSRLPFNVVVETINKLKEEKLVDFIKHKVVLTSTGEQYIEEKKIFPYDNFTCQSCAGRGISASKLAELKKRFENAASGRPAPVIEFDQGYVTSETTAARVALMASRGDLRGKALLLLGDDDLVSLAAGLSGMPEEVIVLEVDERLIDFINTTAKKNSLPVKAVAHDLKYKIPKEMEKRFDVFLCDPPETIEGLEIFLGRGLAGLKGAGCAGYFGLTYTESSLLKWAELQNLLNTKFNVVITDLIHDFNLYENWDYLLGSIRDDLPPLNEKPDGYWYRSSMYRIETLFDSPVENEDRLEEPLYVDREALVYTKKEKR